MIGLWLGLNLADLITTLAAFEMGYKEGNPLVSGLEPVELVGYKVVLMFVVILLLAGIKRIYLLKPLCLIMGMVVVWNLVWVIKGG